MSTAAYQEVARCRVCGNDRLDPILHLGVQHLTGVFPQHRAEPVSAGPLELVKCHETGRGETCGLVQLRHNYRPDDMYRGHYGYRSGLNELMVRHLHELVAAIEQQLPLRPGDVVLDIGSNDATLLKAYRATGLSRIGIDPSAGNFREFYPPDIALVTDYFSARAYRSIMGTRPARVITSIAMFYDLPSPLEFMREIKEILAPDGLWVFEQSYMPTMLERNAYDTICHEHLEYYGLRQIEWMVERAGLKILDVALNDVNGGSFCVTACHQTAPHQPRATWPALRQAEVQAGLTGLKPYDAFRERVFRHRDELVAAIGHLRQTGQLLLGYGASTKGNVLLQFCGFTERDIPAIADRNPAKFGRFTPGSLIPIIPEDEARARQPAVLLALPWHFREGFLQRERAFLERGGRFLFPLPRLEWVAA